MEGVIFDKKNNIIPNSNGCVLSAVVFKKNWILMNCYQDKEDMVEVGLYVTGWIKTGPVGVVDTTLKDSLVFQMDFLFCNNKKETYVNIKQHYLKGYFEEKEDPRGRNYYCIECFY